MPGVFDRSPLGIGALVRSILGSGHLLRRWPMIPVVLWSSCSLANSATTGKLLKDAPC
ncbi:LOW QUALITY PROTEIN: hypothetical protein Pcar_3421 [Syntrophotalea carbinolica DSM 2380]|uniref:Uncharacterized protein n=1 Tax=Syntrophotalea carbinolica (strain DSM 2380 / NBRC 103641 / GraBd1) TaxID=338963 RepID=J9UA30_SYNC1|nr:LOW QUALITY PROTEIN: hypothetical protein Pcar_3421 [Syntrophotalea carbinolica DSM 2380]